MEASLISSGIPDLLPSRDRSPGIHHSDVLSDLLTRMGHYAPQDPKWKESDAIMTRMQIGLAFEDILVDRYRRHFGVRYIMPGELEIDGLPITLDMFDTLHPGPDSVKFTWLSSRHDVYSDVFIRFWMQLKSECIATSTKQGRLHICHAMGEYDYSKPAVHFNVWKAVFGTNELDTHKTMILKHRDRMLKEGWQPDNR